jgi:hypothetical protein
MRKSEREVLRRLRRPLFLSIFLLLSLALFFSCEDDPSDIGLELKSVLGRVQPVYVDTLQINTSVWTIDSLRTDHSSRLMLGNVMDPVFGWTDASFVTQYRLSNPWIPGNNADVDSVKLFLVVNDYTGNEVTPQRIKVYELFKTLRYDTVYYSNFQVGDSISEWPVGTALFHPGDTMVPVYLSRTFGRKILRDTAVLQDQELFLSHFKGFYVTTEKVSQPGEGGTIDIDLLNAETYMAIYYHNDLSDELMFPFYINGYCARAGMYKHDYEEAPPETAIRYLNQEKGDSVCYVQGLCGVYTKLSIPGLDRYKDSSIVLNTVKLEVPFYYDPMGNILRKPSLLALRVRVGDTIFADVMDRQLPEFYDGTFNEDDNAYYINFTAQIQRYLMGENDYTEYYLMNDVPAFNPERAVLDAWTNSKPMKVILIYTEL